MNLHVDMLTLRLVGGVSAIVAMMLGLGLYLLSSQYHEREMQILRRGVEGQCELVLAALEHAMLERDPRLLREQLALYAQNPAVDQVFIVNRGGEVKFASKPGLEGQVYELSSPDCMGCHRHSKGSRPKAITFEAENGDGLRVVRPIYNKERCWACHPASDEINGMIVMDSAIAAQRTEVAEDLRTMAWWTLGLGTTLLIGITAMVRRLVLVRLSSLVRTARAIAGGDLSRRLVVKGSDPIAQAGLEFNAMADSISRLLDRVRSQRRRIENVMNSVDDGMIVLDRDLNIVACNKAFTRRFGVGREQVLDTPCYTLDGLPCRPGSENQHTACAARSSLASGAVGKCLRTWTDKDGVEHVEEVFASPIIGEDGLAEQVVEVWRDITDRKSIEAQVAEFHRLASLGLLASGISHEVNTPLSTVITCMGAIRDQMGEGREAMDDAAWRELEGYVDLVSDEVMRCKGLTRRLLVFAKSRVAEPEILYVDDVVEAVLPLAHKIAADGEVRLDFVRGERPPPVVAPAGAVHQVFLNLIVNAVQACDVGGRVQIEWTADDFLRVRVSDDGHGIECAKLQSIFEPFYTTRQDGTGLGLFVSLGLARGWGGDIRVTSEPGRGASFEVSFPLETDIGGELKA